MGVTGIIDLKNTFLAQCCISVGMAGHERVKFPMKTVECSIYKAFVYLFSIGCCGQPEVWGYTSELLWLQH